MSKGRLPDLSRSSCDLRLLVSVAAILVATCCWSRLAEGAASAADAGDKSCPCIDDTAVPQMRSVCRPAWTEVTTPSGSNSFYDVVAVSRTDVWAVGSRYDGTTDLPLAEHFDGKRWVSVSVPAPGTGAAYLRAVAGVSGSDIWAGGYQSTQSGVQKTLFEHYDRTSWTIIPSPNPASFAAYISSLDFLATNDVWAAGYYINNAGVYQTLVEHWDGTAWTIAPTPNAGEGDNALNGIAGVSPDDLWAVGYWEATIFGASATLVLHFDGLSWTVVSSPNPGGLASSLSSVAALSDGTIWAAGFYYDGSQGRSLLIKGVGTVFTVFPGEDYLGEGNVLNGIAASAPGDIWAVGYHYPNGTSDYQGLIEHYDGQQWRRVSSAQGGSYTYLAAVAAQPAGAGWAVGNTLTATIAESICEVQVGEAGFVPKSAVVAQGDTVGWSFIGTGVHQLVDPTGMSLFDSGSRTTGSSFQYGFTAAGSYPVKDQMTNANSTVGIPMLVPARGRLNQSLSVTWSVAAPAEGFLFDAQVQVPGGTFQDWMTGQTETSAIYVPSVVGDFAFRARLRQSANGAASNWSPPAVVNVAAR